jgi:signal transduction histidine kinase
MVTYRSSIIFLCGVAAIALICYCAFVSPQIHVKAICFFSCALIVAMLLLGNSRQALLGEGTFMNRLNNYASIVLHELKNPLASLKNVAYYLSKTIPSDNATTTQMIATLSSEVDRLNSRIKELLDNPRVKTLQKQPSDMAIIAAAAIEKLKVIPMQIEKNISPTPCIVDPAILGRAIEHILLNAAEALPNKGPLRIEVLNDGADAVCRITDSGPGMDKEILALATGPLFSSKEKHIGLGLTIAQKIVQMHGGTLNILSRPRQGTSVTIRLPKQGSAL